MRRLPSCYWAANPSVSALSGGILSIQIRTGSNRPKRTGSRDVSNYLLQIMKSLSRYRKTNPDLLAAHLPLRLFPDRDKSPVGIAGRAGPFLPCPGRAIPILPPTGKFVASCLYSWVVLGFSGPLAFARE